MTSHKSTYPKRPHYDGSNNKNHTESDSKNSDTTNSDIDDLDLELELDLDSELDLNRNCNLHASSPGFHTSPIVTAAKRRNSKPSSGSTVSPTLSSFSSMNPHADLHSQISPRSSIGTAVDTDKTSIASRETMRRRERRKSAQHQQGVSFRDNSFSVNKMNNSMTTLSISPSNHSSIPHIMIPSPTTDANPLDAMEKEQEGIVMKLLHEIQSLRDENKMLKTILRVNPTAGSPPPSPNAGATKYQPYLVPASTSTSNLSTNSNSTAPSSPFMSQRRATITTIANQKRTPSLVPVNPSLGTVVNPRSRSGSFNTVWKFPNSVTPTTQLEPFPFDNEYYPFVPQRFTGVTPTVKYPSIGSFGSVGSANGADNLGPLVNFHSRSISLDSDPEEAIEDDVLIDDTNNDGDDEETDSSYYSNYSTTIGSYTPIHKRSASENTTYSILHSSPNPSSLRDSKPKDATKPAPTSNVSPGLLIKHQS